MQRILATLLTMAIALVAPIIAPLEPVLFPQLPEASAEDGISQDVTVMSFNVYVAGTGKKSPENRTAAVVQTILDEAPDSFGLQEVDAGWRARLEPVFEEAGYAFAGIGRDKGEKGESSPVFYRSDKYTLVGSGTFWLSKTPEKPSRGWDAMMRRVCSWVILRDKKTGFTYAHFNAHMDHIGSISRAKSAELILEQIEAIAPDIPVVVTGDFNAKAWSQPYRLMVGGGFFDTRHVAEDTMYGATYHAYSEQDKTNFRPIDYIFVSGQARRVASYRVIKDMYDGVYPSDHYAICAVVTFANQG